MALVNSSCINVVYPGGAEVTVRDSRTWALRGMLVTPNGRIPANTNTNFKLYRNKTDNEVAALSLLSSWRVISKWCGDLLPCGPWTTAHEVTDNQLRATHASAYFLIVDCSGRGPVGSSGSYFRRNSYFAPRASAPFRDEAGGTSMNFAEWQSCLGKAGDQNEHGSSLNTNANAVPAGWTITGGAGTNVKAWPQMGP